MRVTSDAKQRIATISLHTKVTAHAIGTIRAKAAATQGKLSRLTPGAEASSSSAVCPRGTGLAGDLSCKVVVLTSSTVDAAVATRAGHSARGAGSARYTVTSPDGACKGARPDKHIGAHHWNSC